jgi:LacI family transcriptional regulator
MGELPKYKTIFNSLKEELLDGKYDAKHPFPSETALTRRFGAARHTVLRAVRELQSEGFLVRRQGAGTFITRKARATRRIALVVHGSDYCEIFSPIAREVSHLCQARGYSLLLGDVAFPDPRRRAERVLELVREYVKQGVDGVILQPVELLEDSDRINEQVCSVFDAASVPVVLLDSDIVTSPARSRYDLVGINHFDAGRRLAEHLRAAGAKRIAYLMQKNRAPCVRDRWLGLKFGCDGLAFVAKQIFAEPDNIDAVRAFLRRHRPDAIACYNDRQAAVLMQTLAKLGKKVPSDIKLAGFDDVNYATLVTPHLTTLHQPCSAIARTAVDILFARIDDPSLPPREVFLAAPLVVRESTGR